jgi:phospholipid-transporting ATPase
MSVLVQDAEGKYYLFIKGADNVILERLKQDSDDSLEAMKLNNSIKHLERFASEGLRTLCFACRELEAETAVEWLEKWNVALNTVNDRQRVIDEAAAEIENDLVFIGATGVEDRLQESVVDTIQSLYKADINIWMLTGDRFETAVSAGFLSGLIDTQTKQLHVLIPEYNEIIKTLKFYDTLTNEASSDSKFALVINGATITIVFSELFTETDKALFKRIVQRCRTLLCCRLSPLQKAQITEFVRYQLQKIALAIGDGGNDVSMIQAANIGVGISGKEGLQASRSADFSIAKFKYLKRLLLVHGAWAIYRVSRMVIYALYKNILMYVFNFWYSYLNSFSASTLVDGFALSDWNLLYTCWGPTVIGLTDRFVCEEELMKNPQLYRFGQRGSFVSFLNRNFLVF